MAEILITTTSLNTVVSDFTLTTIYSGETNPNVTYDYTLTVKDTYSVVIEGAEVIIGENTLTTDSNGQVSISLIRGEYTAYVSKEGYVDNDIDFEISDQAVSQNIQLSGIGSFDTGFDVSFD